MNAQGLSHETFTTVQVERQSNKSKHVARFTVKRQSLIIVPTPTACPHTRNTDGIGENLA